MPKPYLQINNNEYSKRNFTCSRFLDTLAKLDLIDNLTNLHVSFDSIQTMVAEHLRQTYQFITP